MYDLFLVIFLALPPQPDVSAAMFSWGQVIFLGTNIIACVSTLRLAATSTEIRASMLGSEVMKYVLVNGFAMLRKESSFWLIQLQHKGRILSSVSGDALSVPKHETSYLPDRANPKSACAASAHLRGRAPTCCSWVDHDPVRTETPYAASASLVHRSSNRIA